MFFLVSFMFLVVLVGVLWGCIRVDGRILNVCTIGFIVSFSIGMMLLFWVHPEWSYGSQNMTGSVL